MNKVRHAELINDCEPVNLNAIGNNLPCLRIQPECKRNQYFMRIVGKPNLPQLDLLLEQT